VVGNGGDRCLRPSAPPHRSGRGRDARPQRACRPARAVAGAPDADRPAVSGGDGGARLSLEALCLIADAYLELPDEASAQRLLESARKLAPPAGSGIEPRRPLIESLARLGREEDALALAREVDAEEEGLAAVGAMRAERGDEAGALEVARAISDPPLQQRVQTALAIFYAKQSRWEDAYATAGRGFPAIALSQILREQARSGVPDGVARTLALVQGPEEDKAWSLLRRTYLGVYDLAGVDAAPGGMQSVERARLLLHDGRREEALAIAEGWRRTRDPMRAFDLAELALEAARLFDPVEYDPFGVDD
jgi:hypothetical protein